ncbi:prophage protein (fragment) [Escherichia coli]
MSTITKERIELFIKSPLENGLTRGEQMELARIALASLEAEPVGAFHIAEQQVDGTSDYIKDGEWPIDNGTIEVYGAPPVPVVPAALPDNDDEDGHDIDYLEPSEVYSLGRTAGWNACRAAMLHGAEPVSQTYKLNELSGNSPVTPDGWISCSERMPEIRQTVIGWNGYAVRQCVYTRNEYAKTQKGREPRFEILTGIWHGVTHWMPLPEPPQEAKRWM